MNTKRIKLIGVLALMIALTFTMAACDLADDDEVVPKTYSVVFTVVDEDAEAIEDATVELNDDEGTTDESGVVEFTDMENGTYDYTVTAEGYEEETGEVVVDGADESVSVTMTAEDPVDPDPVVVFSDVTDSLGLGVGETAEIDYDVDPDDADVTFASDDEEVATVDEDGVVTAVAVGEAEITLTGTYDDYEDGTASVPVTVTEEPIDPEPESKIVIEIDMNGDLGLANAEYDFKVKFVNVSDAVVDINDASAKLNNADIAVDLDTTVVPEDDSKTVATGSFTGVLGDNEIWAAVDTNEAEGWDYTTTKDIELVAVEFNGQPFATVEEAIEAAEAGDTVTLHEDVEETVAINKNITFDLNGYEVQGDMGVYESGITVKNGTITGDLYVAAEGTTSFPDVTVEGNLVRTPSATLSPKPTVQGETFIADINPDPLVLPDDPIELIYVSTWKEFNEAISMNARAIELEANITVEQRTRITYDLELLDMAGYRLTLEAPLTFEGDDILVKNGVIRGDLVYEGDVHQHDPVVMIDGDSVEFDNITFDVLVLDWYQNQPAPASNLVIKNSDFYGQAIFVSDVRIEDSFVYDRIDINNNDAVLNRVTFAEDVSASYGNGTTPYGILYVDSDASLNDITWADNFTGMYVGKSLKHGTYSPAQPTLDGATITTTKEGMVWWGINHEKAVLTVDGTVNIESDLGGHGLTLVGTDAKDYLEADGIPAGDYIGGHIKGNATFEGAPVHFGWHTGDYIYEMGKDYDGEYYGEIGESVKTPVIPKEVDEQVRKKNADRLTIHDLTFNNKVGVFTPANHYIEDPEAPLLDPVYLGDITFNETVELWGDFAVVDRKTVTNNKEIKTMCGNIRKIFARSTGTTGILTLPDEDKPSHVYDEFEKSGTVTGGRIVSDTKGGVLVLGDQLLVDNTLLHDTLYNVILETAKLKNLNINVGDAYTRDDYVLGVPLDYDVHVWHGGHHAIFEDVTWSTDTRVEVKGVPDGDREGAMLTFVGDITNRGTIKFQTYASVGFGDDVTFLSGRDPRVGHTTAISESGGFVHVDVSRSATPGWTFNDWKNNVMLSASDGMVSAKYEFDINGVKYIIDLRDPDNYDWATSQGFSNVWLTDIMGEDMDYFGDNDISVRITLDENANGKEFDLTADGWFLNSCTRKQINLGEDTKTVEPDGKKIQIFSPSIVKTVDNTPVDETEVEVGDIIDVTWRVVSNKAGSNTQTISAWWEIDGTQMDSFTESVTLGQNQSWTVEEQIDTDVNGAGEYKFSLSTEDMTYTQTVTVVEDEPDDASIALTKSADVATYDAVGDEITYTFTVLNDGNVTLENVTVEDPLFGQSFGPIAELDPGDDEVFTYVYEVTQDDLDAGSIENTAYASGWFDGVEYTDNDDETVDAVQPEWAGSEQQPVSYKTDGELKLLFILGPDDDGNLEVPDNDYDGEIVVELGDDSYIAATLNGVEVDAWCTDGLTEFDIGEEYKYWEFDPFDAEDMDALQALANEIEEGRFEDHYEGIPWDKVEWLINQNYQEDYEIKDVQHAIWYFTNPDVDEGDLIGDPTPNPDDRDAIIQAVKDHFNDNDNEVVEEATVEDLDGELQSLAPGAWNVIIPFAEAEAQLGATTDDVLELHIKDAEDEVEVYDMNYAADHDGFVKTNLQIYTEEQVEAALVSVK